MATWRGAGKGAVPAGELMKLHEAVVKGRFPGRYAALAHRQPDPDAAQILGSDCV